jgi:hypothetical protein
MSAVRACNGWRLQVTRVFKFGGSSVRDAERMQEVAKIVEAFPEELVRPPCNHHPSTRDGGERNATACGRGLRHVVYGGAEWLEHVHDTLRAYPPLPPSDTRCRTNDRERRHLQPALVLSAMGKTTNNLLAAGEAALEAAGSTPVGLDDDGPYAVVRKLHIDTMDTLQTDEETRTEVMTLLDQLHQLLGAIGIMQVGVRGVEFPLTPGSVRLCSVERAPRVPRA